MIAWPLLFVVLGILFIAFAGLGSLFRARLQGYEHEAGDDDEIYTSRPLSPATPAGA